MKNFKNIHFMGIGGSGMKGVARLARKFGYRVTGCDLKTTGHDKAHLKGADLLVVSPAILYQNSRHPEYLEAKKKKMVMTWQEFLGKIILRHKKLIAVAGTHGKSTTTAMVGKMLEDNGFDPIVVLGAEYTPWKGSMRYGKGDWAVVEADEFNDNFLNYNPEIIILNNIEFDHPDFFKSKKQLNISFDKFISKLKKKDDLITQKDSLNKKFNLKIFGKHNQENANMVYVLGQKLGISSQKIIKSLEDFEGIKRRMEYLGKNKKGFKVYDDYAHHPTAIKTTLEGLRNKYPNKKIIAIIEPHGYKRTKALLDNYKGVFDSVDSVIIGPIFKARDKVDKSINLEKIAKVSGHKDIYFDFSIETLIKNFKLKILNYDIVVVMGAGKSNIWVQKLLKI